MANESGEQEAICIEISDAEFALMITDPEVRGELSRPSAILSTEKESIKQKIIDALPRVVAKKVMSIMPDELEVYEITMKVSFSAKPLDVGLETDATIKFGPRRQR